ncbi:putative P-loop containing nucleoside triphosphate hydrolase [Medicago truncatula]|uniref:Putative P-loop containing nucleoside triphosphate hydrolase n=1 Tax=Medicago truncatula TaxID=3880 RepID=A0A396IUL7_MEDTR|nr:putative P-loop containing nucleoside triphosphate hydrolase [Medicago truncatula]
MTVNKSQGQSLKNVGFFFAKSCIFACLALRCNFKSHFKRQVKDTNV